MGLKGARINSNHSILTKKMLLIHLITGQREKTGIWENLKNHLKKKHE